MVKSTHTLLATFELDESGKWSRVFEWLAYNDIEIEYYDTPPLDTSRWE